ncbi:alpha/beta hydrolase [Streptomyces sp. TRM 70351]|uniref:alpha/beta fold hydrolase n=1 Tax=Streptomyces sp. TRM 70351 TaxID=3116552 RepID=UPI002E7C3C2B|nr:alpha/beta hydrolase [Streptomyces sp. TRM 70351]MEE1928041.1 alpha/beta hydrolase [Streptomyces sp. TRM 70351]
MSDTGWARRAGLAGAALGALAAGVAVERLTVHRAVRRRARLSLDAAGPYGTLRGTPGTATADDGTRLHYETDEPVREPGPRTPPTVVFSHGYCLNQDAWHFQRAALRELGTVRAVYWDQRGHGRSARGPGAPGGPGAPPATVPERSRLTVEQLGRDLRAVLDAAVPEGPVILVGHSMGGMTMMALAAQYPDWVEKRVTGAAFVATSAGALSEVTYGLPAAGVRALRRVVPGVLGVLTAHSTLVERGRAAGADLLAGLVRHYSFGAPRSVDPAVARFAERLLEGTPIDVVAEFYPAFHAHEQTAALAAFGAAATVVLAGERDLLTPRHHSEAIAAELPGARLDVLPETGHLLMLERPEALDARLRELLEP